VKRACAAGRVATYVTGAMSVSVNYHDPRGWEVDVQVWPEYRDPRGHDKLRAAAKAFRHVTWVILVLVVGGVLLFALGDWLWHSVVTAPHPTSCQTGSSGTNGSC